MREQIFGRGVSRYLDLLDSLSADLAGTRYRFMDPGEYGELLRTNLRQAMAVYWHELLGRAHLTAAASIIRALRWADGATKCAGAGNYLAFSASMRGLIESAADGFHALLPVPKTLARDREAIEEALAGRMGMAFVAPELEGMLIHFSHARRLSRGEEAPPDHVAKTVKEYLKSLEAFRTPAILECYAELCSLTHAAAPSVWSLLQSCSSSEFRLTPSQDPELINAFARRYAETLGQLCMTAFNPGVVTLALLNHFPCHEYRCRRLEQWDLREIELWRDLEPLLRKRD